MKNSLKNLKKSTFSNYADYLKIQYRTDPKEFMDSRLRIVSSFVYLIPILEKFGISSPRFETDGPNKGQLKDNTIHILDAGCRDGWTIEFLNSIGYTNVLGIELFDEYINYAKKLGRNVEKGDLHDLKFKDNTFDFIYCRHVLEHSLDPLKVLNEMVRVVKSGGAVYCSFPLEENTFGKHTVAIPDIKTLKSLVSSISYDHKDIYIGISKKTKIVMPEGKEAIVFILKK